MSGICGINITSLRAGLSVSCLSNIWH